MEHVGRVVDAFRCRIPGVIDIRLLNPSKLLHLWFNNKEADDEVLIVKVGPRIAR